MSLSSDYFDDDPEFVKALAEVQIPDEAAPMSSTSTTADNANEDEPEDDGMPPSTQPSLKRRRTPDSDDDSDDRGASKHAVLSSVDQDKVKAAYLSSDTYGASRFGGFGEYMQRKRQKLQIQNAEIDDEDGETTQVSSKIFKGLQIYVCPWSGFVGDGMLIQNVDQWVD